MKLHTTKICEFLDKLSIKHPINVLNKRTSFYCGQQCSEYGVVLNKNILCSNRPFHICLILIRSIKNLICWSYFQIPISSNVCFLAVLLWQEGIICFNRKSCACSLEDVITSGCCGTTSSHVWTRRNKPERWPLASSSDTKERRIRAEELHN
jgi:hypothetical protein